jgi:LuxR family maltose regulon positive regulatory protein
LVSRPRLVERLNAGLDRKLTLVSAPAGFGKTTLISEWIASRRRGVPRSNRAGTRGGAPAGASTADEASVPLQVAWLSLDEGDNDPTRFWTYFIAALQTVEANLGTGAFSVLQSPQPPPSQVIPTTLINEIAALSAQVVIVLDDYHLLAYGKAAGDAGTSQAIHDALAFLLRRLPPQLHLVIVTREDPLLPLARLRARGQLTELRAADLRFTPSEAAEFLNTVMGLALSAPDIAALETRTEGWIAGLQLAALAIQGALDRQGSLDTTGFIQSFTGSHRFVLDYLVGEVLEQQPEDVQAFLQQTCFLDRLTGPLCDAVQFGGAELQSSSGGTASGKATLERLERANLFIVPLDGERRWYRYHHLFADLLRQRLRQDQLEQLPALHRRASEWCERSGLTDEAIEYALRGKLFERAADLIERAADANWQGGEHIKLQRWLAGLPAELVSSRPFLCIYHAWGLFVGGQHDAAEQRLRAAESALNARAAGPVAPSAPGQGRRPGSPADVVRGRAAAFRAFMATYHGDTPRMLEHSRRALECLPEQDLSWRIIASIALADAHLYQGEYAAAHRARLETLEASKATGNVYLVMTSSLRLATILREQGQLPRVIETCQQQLQLARANGLSQSASVGWLLALWGEVLAERNELDEALDKVRRGLDVAQRGGDIAILGLCSLCLVRVLFSRGELAGATEIVQKLERLARQYAAPPWMTSETAAWQARIWLAQDKPSAASRWARDRGLGVDGTPSYLNELEYRVLVRILFAQRQLADAVRLLRRLLAIAETGDRTSAAIEVLILQALAYQAQEDSDRAIAALEQALALGEPGGFCRIFVDEGPPMARLLYVVARRGTKPDYAGKLLAAFPAAPSDLSFRPSAGTEISKSEIRKSEIIEPLSERELEVLQLIAEGLTNPEIAARLYLSLNTVKAHTRNIYGKLGVHSRTQATSRARALGVLPSEPSGKLFS